MDIFGNFEKLKGDSINRKVSRKPGLDFDYTNVSMEAVSKVEEEKSHGGSFLLKAALFLVFAIFSIQLFRLQVYQGEAMEKLADGNRIRPRILESKRGLIVDQNGLWLARNRPAFALALYPSDLPREIEDRRKIYENIASLANLDINFVKGESEKEGLFSFNKIIIKDNLSHEEALLLEEGIEKTAGFFIDKRSLREYRFSSGLSHLIGYTGIVSESDLKNFPNYFPSDSIGKSGLESQYETFLRGTYGVEQIEVDSRGNIIRILAEEASHDPLSGNEIVLNLDLGLQEKTAVALNDGIKKAKEDSGLEVKSGVAIVMDVKTGAIKSMVSLPDYDNNLFIPRISNDNYQELINDKSKPMFNRAVSGIYPPGSIIKIVMAAAGLSEGVITEKTAFDTPAAIQIGDYIFPDWTQHGMTDVKTALAESNNIFFYAVGGGYDGISGLGIDRINNYWKLFGLGSKTGIDLPGEVSGFLPNALWKRERQNEPWYIGDTYHVSIGQGGLLATPLQLVSITGAIANGGKLMVPKVVDRIKSSDGEVLKKNEPEIRNQDFINSNILRIINEGMRMAVTGGSARVLKDLNVSVAAKTGTAQFDNNQRTHAWITAYAPYENPEIAVLVLVEGGGGGHAIAGPVAKEILEYYFRD